MNPRVKGSQAWAVLLCTPSDRKAPSSPALGLFTGLISRGGGGLYDFWSQMSGGQVDLEGSQVFGWYKLGAAAADVGKMSRAELVAAARAAAAREHADLSGFRHTLAISTESDAGGNTDYDVAVGLVDVPGQLGWRHCSKCHSLAFWDDTPEPGPCLAGGKHEHYGSSTYSIINNTTTFAGGQPGWRWCSRCFVMVFHTAPPAACPGGGTHDLTKSGDYVIRVNATVAGEQNGWYWCKKCQQLAFRKTPSAQPGPCPAGGQHDHTTSGNYSIPIGWKETMGFFAHETGHAFGLDHAFGPNRAGSFKDDGRPGAYGDVTDIMSYSDTKSFATAHLTEAAAGMSAAALDKMGWIRAGEATTLVTPGGGVQVVALAPLYAGAGAGGGLRMARVLEPARDRVYTVECRTPSGWDRGLDHARVVVHTARSLFTAGQGGWRWCASCEGLVYAGRMPCPAGGVHDGRGSPDYGVLHDVGPSQGQPNWRLCRKCAGLVFAGHGSGLCPAGGEHDVAGSHDYVLPSGDGGAGSARWCCKCQGLGIADNALPGACPAGAFHNYSASGQYLLGTGGGAHRQNRWRRCLKCDGLYRALGPCGGGGAHDLGADSGFSLVHDVAGAVGQAGWMWCKKCHGLAFVTTAGPPGVCPGGGTHSHADSASYVVPMDAEAAAAQLSWYRCGKCTALTFLDASRGPGPCSAGGRHDSSGVVYLVPHDTTAVKGRAGFNWCRKCECLVLGNSPPGCKAGGNHDTSASAAYVVRTDPSTLVREQPFWRTCSKCSALMMLASEDGKKEQPCAAGGTHAPQGEYFLTFQNSDPFWRWCRKCEVLAYWDRSRQEGPCPAGGRHDHGASAYYNPASFAGDVAQVVAVDLLSGQRFVTEGGGLTVEVISVENSGAKVRLTTG